MKPRLAPLGLVCALAIICTTALAVMSQSCKRLVQYRDTTLVADLDKASSKLVMASSALALVKKIQAEARDLAAKQPSINAAFQLVLSLRTVAAAVGGILKINPQTGVLMNGAGRADAWVGRILNAGTAAEVSSAANSGTLVNYLFWETVGDAGPTGASLKAVQEFAENINEQKEQYDDGRAMLDAAQARLKRLENMLTKAEGRVKNQAAKVAAVNEFKNEIDKSCH